jgi:hypothetical protein
MSNLKLSTEFIKLVNKKLPTFFNDGFCIIYGSTAIGSAANNSDLDVMFCKQSFTIYEYSKLLSLLVSFHAENDLVLDSEVPYQNKLCITFDDCTTASKLTFVNENTDCKVYPIVKSKQFLGSEILRYRLILNIFTTPHLYFGSSKYHQIKSNMHKALCRLCLIIADNELDLTDLVNNLVMCKITGATREDFLGYKNKLEIRSHLEQIIFTELIDMIISKKLEI